MSKVIYQAKKIITMNPSLPEAEYIAQHDGRIVSVGPYEAIEHLLDEYKLDTRFKSNVIVPGFVEGHAHVMEGTVWQYVYLGYFDRTDPEGKLWTGVTNIAQIQARLKLANSELKPGEILVAWGLDPIYFPEYRLSRHHIDAVVPNRLVVILHASFHAITVNSATLSLAGLQNQTDIEGVLLDEQGELTGELQEMPAMGTVFQSLDTNLFDSSSKPDSLYHFGRSASRVGITTATDLYNPLTEKGLKVLTQVTAEKDFPIRLAPVMRAINYSIDEGIEKITHLKTQSTNTLFFGGVKLIADGSIQGHTARLMYPGYHKSDVKGLWNTPPETLSKMIHAYHQAGINLHIHTNGEEAAQIIIESIESALAMVPWMNHRHTLQHCQLVTQAQIKRIANAKIAMNIFSNHIYYWGEQHLTQTIGYERAQRLEPIRSAKEAGIMVALHSDAPVTPLDPLFSMSCAVNRTTASGRQLGKFESVSAYDALEMVTINPAYTLHLDHLIGSLECGKFADFAVLDECPLSCDSDRLKEISVLSTVLNGEVVYGKVAYGE